MATSQQFTATVTMTDSSTRDVTNDAAWTSSSPDVATVSATGLVTAVAAGETTITATYQDTTDIATVTVAAGAQSLAVTPDTASLDEP